MKPKIVGYYRYLSMYPDTYSTCPVYRTRWHCRLGFQVKIEAFGELIWINTAKHYFSEYA